MKTVNGLCLPRGNNQSLADAQGAWVGEVVSLGDGFVGNVVALCYAIKVLARSYRVGDFALRHSWAAVVGGIVSLR